MPAVELRLTTIVGDTAAGVGKVDATIRINPWWKHQRPVRPSTINGRIGTGGQREWTRMTADDADDADDDHRSLSLEQVSTGEAG